MLLTVLKTLFPLLVGASIAYYLLCLLAASRFFAKDRFRSASPPPPGASPLRPPASILVPLCGVDFEAYENYASLCRQDYPTFQIVFGVQDPADSSIAVIRRLMADFPSIDIKLVIGRDAAGQNPKVNNLHNMLPYAKYDILVIADSDIRVKPDYLETVASPLADSTIGLTTCFYRAGSAPSLGARLEAAGISAEFAPGVLTANMLEGLSFALGATMAVTRRSLNAAGGFSALADYLADDFMLGSLVHRQGFSLLLLPYTVETLLPPLSLKGMIAHQIRWARGIHACRPWGHFGSVVSHGLVLAALNVLVQSASPFSAALFALTAILRLATAWRVGVVGLSDSLLKRYFWLIPLRDIFSFCFWWAALAGKEVDWRGQRYRLVGDGKIRPVEPKTEKAVP